MKTLTAEEKHEISLTNARQFLAECPEFYGSEYNGNLIERWLTDQIGTAYPFSVENYWAAFEYLSEHGRFESRPVGTAPAPQVHRSSGIVSTITGVLADDAAIADNFKALGNTATSGPLDKKSLAELKAAATKQRVALIEERGDSLARLQERGKYVS
jgi:hypothetical protein